MARGRGTGESNTTEITITDIGTFRASRVSGGDERENSVDIPDGDAVQKAPGPIDYNDLTVEVPVGQYEDEMRRCSQWREEIANRVRVIRRSIFRTAYDETGVVPITTEELRRCWIKSMNLNDATGRGTGHAVWTLVFAVEGKERF